MNFKTFTSILFVCGLLCFSTSLSAMNPVNADKTLTKKEQRQQKRQQKIINFAEKLMAKKMDRFIEQHQLFADSTKCDTIILRNGKELVAKIGTISDKGVNYKKCENPDSPEILLSNAAIKEIIYANGERNKIEDLGISINNDSSRPERSTENNRKDRGRDTSMSLSQAKGIGILLGVALGIIGILVAYFAFTDEPKKIQKALVRNAWAGVGIILALNLLILLAYAAIYLSF